MSSALERGRGHTVAIGRALAVLTLVAVVPSITTHVARATPLYIAPYTFYDTGNQPFSVAVGDLNGDGRPDVAAACTGSGTAAVLFGAPGGVLGPKTEYAVGSQPRAIAIGDLNGDGHPDLAVANSTPNNAAASSMSVLINNGNWTFHPAVHYPSGQVPLGIAIGDLNGDGHPDIVTANQFGNSVSIFINHGDGTFAPRTDINTSPSPQTVAIGDLNNDGRQDLVVDGGSVALGNGNGTFGPFVFQGVPAFVVLGDVNNDGKLDLVGAYGVRLGNGDGTFGSFLVYESATGDQITRVAIGDINHDGRLDIATCSIQPPDGSFTDDISIMLGYGDGTFAPHRDLPTGMRPQAIQIASLDGQHAEVVVANQFVNAVSVYIGNGVGSFPAVPYFSIGGEPNVYPDNTQIGDFNGDGIPDVAVALRGSASVSVILGTGHLDFGPPTLYGPREVVSLRIGDLNEDGAPDLVVSNTAPYPQHAATISVMLGNGDGTFGPSTDITVGPDPAGLTIGDFDGDGHLDVAVARTDTISIMHGLGNGGFAIPVGIAINFASTVDAADVNGDGKLDLVVPNYTTGFNVAVLLGNGNGTFGPEIDNPVPYRSQLALGDFNGDGRLDLVLDEFDGAGTFDTAIKPGQGNGIFGARSVLTFDTRGVAGIGDIDGDGRQDIATGSAAGSAVLLGNGNGTFGSKIGVGPTLFRALHDMDGDGRPEIIGTRSRYDNLFFVLKNTAALTSAPLPGTPASVALAQSIPNPARDGVAISFTIPQRGQVSIRLYDVSGRMVRTLYDGPAEAGSHTVRWDRRSASGQRVAPGLYFYDLNVEGARLTRRLVVVE